MYDGVQTPQERDPVSNFDSLTIAFEPWFDVPLADLPPALRERIDEDFAPMPWDSLSPDRRRSVALQLDYQNDPAMETERQFWWDFFERIDVIQKQIVQWQSVTTPTAGELALKENRLADLRQELAKMEAQQRQARGDYPPADYKCESPVLGSQEWRTQNAKHAANALHDKPGGNRDKQRQIREIWAKGNYSSRTRCAEEECAALGMGYDTARRALTNMPDPSRC